MPKLTVTANESTVVIQDTFPAEGGLVIKAEPGTPKEAIVSWGQFQRIRDQLTALEEDGLVSYLFEASGKDIRGDEHDLDGLPSVLALDTATTALAAGGAVTGAKALGAGLLGGQVKAELTLGNTADANGHIEFTAVVPGANGNDIVVEFVTGAAEAVAVVGDTITVTLNTGVSTYNSIATTMNGDATVAAMVLSADAGTGLTVAVVEDAAHLTGGTGAGITLEVGGVAAVINSVSDTVCDYDVDLTTLTAADTALWTFRSGTKLTQFGVVLS